MLNRMIVLGTGGAVSTRYRNTCFVLTDGQELFLTDGGGGHELVTAFRQQNLDWNRLHHAFLSHEHTDHLLGMVWAVRMVAEMMLYWRCYPDDFTVYSHDVGLEKLREVCRLLLKPSQYALIGQRIHLVSVEDRRRLRILDTEFTFFDIHSTKAKQFGYRMDRPALVFLGDEPFSERCADLVRPCDWLLSEAFCLDAERQRYRPGELHHATVREAARCAARFDVRNLVLWHTEDETTYGRRRELYTAEAAQYCNCRVWVPEDGETIPLTEEKT